jgi:hypothetical protein
VRGDLEQNITIKEDLLPPLLKTDELFDDAPSKRVGTIYCRTSVVVKATLKKLQALGET